MAVPLVVNVVSFSSCLAEFAFTYASWNVESTGFTIILGFGTVRFMDGSDNPESMVVSRGSVRGSVSYLFSFSSRIRYISSLLEWTGHTRGPRVLSRASLIVKASIISEGVLFRGI